MLILGQLCGGISTIQMVCVSVGWVVVGWDGGSGAGWWLSFSSSFFLCSTVGVIVNIGKEK